MMMTMSIWIQRQSVRLCHWNVGHLEWNGMEWDIDTSVVLFELDITRAWTPSFNRRSFVQQDAPPSRRNGWTLQLCMFHNKRRRKDEGDCDTASHAICMFHKSSPHWSIAASIRTRLCVLDKVLAPASASVWTSSSGLNSQFLRSSFMRADDVVLKNKASSYFILIGRAAAVDAMAISIRIVL